MRTIKETENLITGIIVGFKNEDNFERKSAQRIIEALIEEDNLNVPPIIDKICDHNYVNSVVYKGAKYCTKCGNII